MRTRPEAYVRRMVLNEYLSWRRSWAARNVHAVGERLVDLDDARGGVRDHAHDVVEADELWNRLATLGRKQRAVLVLRYYEQLDDDAIADLVGCSPATVRSHASRALKTLRLSSEQTEPDSRRGEVVTEHGDQLREAFETHEHLAPDPAAVYARVQELSRGYQRRRRGAQAPAAPCWAPA